jgi:hypothetical protein
MSGMSGENNLTPAAYREHAMQARSLAARTTDPEIRQQFLDLAKQWEQLARLAEYAKQ